MPTLGELLNLGNKKLIYVPEGFELRKLYGRDKLVPNGLLLLSIYHKKPNGDLGRRCFSGCCVDWDEAVNEIRRCVNSTRAIEFDMWLSFKLYNKTVYEEMFHGIVTKEVFDELIEISKKYSEEVSNKSVNA